MKLGLKRRDVVLLLSLLLIIVALVYYFYFYTDRSADLDSKRIELENLRTQTTSAKQMIASEGLLDNRITELEKNIKKYSEKYYAEIKQENEIVNIETLYETSAIDISSMNFTQSYSKLSELANSALSMINHNVNPLGEVASAHTTETAAETSETTESTGETQGENTQGEEKKAEDTSKNPNFNGEIKRDSLEKTAQAGESSMDQVVQTLTTGINYKGTFEDLEKFMRNIYSNKKYIVLENITIQSDGQGQLSGNLSIAMHGLPKIAELFGPDNHVYYEGITRRASEAEVYQPYATFVKPQVSVPSYTPDYTTPEVEKDPFGVSDGEVAKTLYGFEGTDYFFVPSDETTNGSVTRVAKRKQGLYGALLSYDFMDVSGENVANLVFDKNPIIVNEIADRLELFVYTKGQFNSKIYLVMVDQFSQEHMLEMSINYVKDEEGRSDQWGIASAKFPLSMTSPFAIERIVVQGGDDASTLSGNIVFDNLRMVTMGTSDNLFSLE